MDGADSNGFCGFRYDPQMNADERRRSRPVQPVRSECGSISVHLRFAGITAVWNLMQPQNPLESGMVKGEGWRKCERWRWKVWTCFTD